MSTPFTFTLFSVVFSGTLLQIHMFSKELKLNDLSKDVKVVLIDTPGWSHETSTNIKSEYKEASWFMFD